MLREISWKQFLEWMAFDTLEPIGDRRADWHAASICSSIMNAAAISAGSKTRFKVQDFLLEFGKRGKKEAAAPSSGQPWQQQKLIAQMFVALSKADIKANKTKKRKRNG